MNAPHISSTRRDDPRGQVVVIVAVAFTVMLAFLAVLFDGANGMVTRREMQDGGDAAALAGANVIHVGNPRGCAATAGGAPRATVANAVRTSLTENLGWFDANTAVITCVSGYENQAVSVQLTATAPRFFGGIVGGEITVSTKSSAANQYITGTRYAVVELDPGNATWPNGRRGCPSALLSGGPSITLQATMHINSSCTAANGGALATNGSAATVTMTGGAKMQMVGGYTPSANLNISPAPITGALPIADPLANLPPMSTSGMTLHNGKVTLNAPATSPQVLTPGIYRGGIELQAQTVALMRPGIYVIDGGGPGGGLSVGAQAKLLAVASGVSAPSSNWGTTDCPVNQCGVLIYNTCTACGSSAMGPISIAAGATLKLRAYDPDAIPTGTTVVADYENVLMWQSASPAPSATYAQPPVSLSGGGTVDIRGTVYAPSALVQMGGNSGGSGGSVNLTLQFISWDIEFRGTSGFTFFFSDDEFARPIDYGLIE
jgi:hypothetical protein